MSIQRGQRPKKVSSARSGESTRPGAEVAARLGVSTPSMYAWLKRYNTSPERRQQDSAVAAEIKRLRIKVKCLTDARDIKMSEKRSGGRGTGKSQAVT